MQSELETLLGDKERTILSAGLKRQQRPEPYYPGVRDVVGAFVLQMQQSERLILNRGCIAGIDCNLAIVHHRVLVASSRDGKQLPGACPTYQIVFQGQSN